MRHLRGVKPGIAGSERCVGAVVALFGAEFNDSLTFQMETANPALH